MVLQEVIDPGLAIWIVECSLSKLSPPVWTVDGFSLDGYHGFGSNRDRYFDGEVALLTLKGKFVQHLLIGRIHFSRGGFKWRIEEVESLPEPPFLVSGNLATEIIFNGCVQLNDTQDTINEFEPDCYSYCVATKSWFGLMTPKEHQKVHLLAFSPNQETKVSEDDEVWSPEFDSLIGKLKLL